MKKIILTELLIFLITAGISVGLYHFVYGIDLSINDQFDLVFYNFKRLTIIYIIAMYFFHSNLFSIKSYALDLFQISKTIYFC